MRHIVRCKGRVWEMQRQGCDGREGRERTHSSRGDHRPRRVGCIPHRWPSLPAKHMLRARVQALLPPGPLGVDAQAHVFARCACLRTMTMPSHDAHAFARCACQRTMRMPSHDAHAFARCACLRTMPADAFARPPDATCWALPSRAAARGTGRDLQMSRPKRRGRSPPHRG